MAKSVFVTLLKSPQFKLGLKIILTAAALYFVFQKIPFQEIFKEVQQANFGYLVVSFLLFNLSKIIAAFRLRHFYESAGVFIAPLRNLKLYYLGMFYNLFLPGGIGGDGYKVYLLKQLKGGNTKNLIQATLVDRLSGLAALAFLLGILLFFSVLTEYRWSTPLGIFLLISPFIVLWSIMRLLARFLLPVFLKTSVQSFGVQLSQVVCSLFLLNALGVESHFIEYLLLFLFSSAVSVLPFTVGGVGARELVFVYGYEYLPIEAAAALAFTLLFFAITAISSLLGLAFIRNMEVGLSSEPAR